MNQNKKAGSSSTGGPTEDCIANGAISIKLANLDVLTDINGKAQQVTSGQMKVRKVLKPNKLNLYIHCNEAVKDRLWLCKVHFKVQYWADGVEYVPFYSNSDHFYGFNSHFWIFPIKTVGKSMDSLEIKLGINVCQVLDKSLPPLDTSLVVNMGEDHSELLLVNKHILAGMSSYFRNLFVEDWNDKQKQGGSYFELNEVEDFDIRAFKAMIYSAMALNWMVLESNFLECDLAVEIIQQAIKYDFPLLLHCCEKFLTDYAKDDSHRSMELLELADHFNLDQLKEHCLKQISVLDFVKKEKGGLSDLVKAGIGMLTVKSFNRNTQIFSRLSKTTQEELRTKLDENIDFNECPHSKMALLEVADQYSLVQLKQHCLDAMNLLDYNANFKENHAIHLRLTNATQEELRAKLEGKAEELRDLTDQLMIGIQANKTKRVLVEQMKKFAKALKGHGQRAIAVEDSSDSE